MSEEKENPVIGLSFILIPVILLIVGLFIYPYPDVTEYQESMLQIPMFLGLFLLFFGFILDKQKSGKIFKILGWIVFAFFWATQPTMLYLSEGGDTFNAAVCVIGVFVLCYLAYHEYLSYIRDESISCLNWIAGASFLAGIIYFGIERSALSPWLIDRVAEQSAWVLNIFTGTAAVDGEAILIDGHYAVTIIFACTAIQSMVIFVGMIGALPKIGFKRRIIGLMITVLPVYFLNLFRNAMVAFLVGRNIMDFNLAHNILSKAGSLIALVVLLFIVVKIIPEVFDEIINLTDLYKRNGPIERFIKKLFRFQKSEEKL